MPANGIRSLVALALALMFYQSAAVARAGEPLELVKSVGDRVFALLNDPMFKGTERKNERVERLKEIINPVFDYEEMAQRTLGAHWRRGTAAEQQEFVKLFRFFLEQIYADKLDLYEGERIVLGRETIEQDYAQVEAKLTNAKGDASPLVYRLKRSDGKWKVYDAVVENISIVNNYRSQFDRVITKSNFNELNMLLREKAA